ncbi:MAG: nuclear transport factor 2 family protein [Acidobacteriota bacterium]
MSDKNIEIVKQANALLTDGKNEEFILLCAEDIEWTLLSDSPTTMKGREAISAFMASTSPEGSEPPKFTVKNMIAEGEVVMSNGEMNMKSKEGETVPYAYCDIYRFQNGKIAELLTFMNKTQAETKKESSATA